MPVVMEALLNVTVVRFVVHRPVDFVVSVVVLVEVVELVVIGGHDGSLCVLVGDSVA